MNTAPPLLRIAEGHKVGLRILALDLGRRMGVADGDSALLGRSVPRVEAVILRGASGR